MEFNSPLHSVGLVKTEINYVHRGFVRIELMADMSKVSVRRTIRVVVHESSFKIVAEYRLGPNLFMLLTNKRLADMADSVKDRSCTQ